MERNKPMSNAHVTIPINEWNELQNELKKLRDFTMSEEVLRIDQSSSGGYYTREISYVKKDDFIKSLIDRIEKLSSSESSFRYKYEYAENEKRGLNSEIQRLKSEIEILKLPHKK